LARLEYKKTGSVVQVYLDGESIGPFSVYKLPEYAPYNADDSEYDITEEQKEEIRKLAIKSAFEKYSVQAASREIAVYDIKQKMRMKQYPDWLMELTIGSLYEYHFLDDRRYVESYIRRYSSEKSKSFIYRELLRKQYDQNMIEDIYNSVVEEKYDGEDLTEREAILAVYQRRFAGADLSDEKVKRKVYSYFMRRGYTYGMIKNCLT